MLPPSGVVAKSLHFCVRDPRAVRARGRGGGETADVAVAGELYFFTRDETGLHLHDAPTIVSSIAADGDGNVIVAGLNDAPALGLQKDDHVVMAGTVSDRRGDTNAAIRVYAPDGTVLVDTRYQGKGETTATSAAG